MADRCPWCGTDPVYVAYHDHEWGVPIHDDRALWEALILESFQAGLSWITILRRRDGFRAAFHGFDPDIIAQWGPDEVERLLQDARIIRHRGKIEGTIAAARAFQDIQQSDGFRDFVWRHVGHRPKQPGFHTMAEVPGYSSEAETLSKSLKTKGFKFVGPTICYAFMQAVGMTQDHLTTCFRHKELASQTTAN